MSDCRKPFKWLDAVAGVVIYALWCVLVCAVFAALLVTGGCATVLPDTVSIDAMHTSHHWGKYTPGYEYGKDTEGISEHWNAGALKLDLSEYAQQCADGVHPEFNARASYVIPIPK